jgi:hypothetical protein
MASGWFKLPETGTGDDQDPYRPKVEGIQGIEGYSGRRLGNSLGFVVRVFGTDAALSNLENTPGVARLSEGQVTDRLDMATGQKRKQSEWENRFFVRAP